MKRDSRRGRQARASSDDVSRRELLAGAAGVIGGSLLLQQSDQTSDTTKRQGRPPGPVGRRSPHETPERLASAISSRTPHQDLLGMITPSDLHFERHHAGIPDVDPATYTLMIHGMVERPTIFTLEDLRRFPATSRICFLECSGNFRSNAPEETTPQVIAGLTSQSEWTGVMLETLFREVGVRPEATWFLAEGQDGAVMGRSIPVEKAWDDAMIAYGQNGEPLRPAQGYPARLLLPGWEGNANVKWIRRIELSDRPFQTRDETSRYTEVMADGRIRQFSFLMDTRSIITSPCYPGSIRPGANEIRGIAWSGRGRIERVEVSTDGGGTWRTAGLQEPVLPKAHTRFRLPWRWDGGEVEILSRAVDETGFTQPTLTDLAVERGAGGPSYHMNPIVGWRVRPSGEVVFRTERWPA